MFNSNSTQGIAQKLTFLHLKIIDYEVQYIHYIYLWSGSKICDRKLQIIEIKYYNATNPVK